MTDSLDQAGPALRCVVGSYFGSSNGRGRDEGGQEGATTEPGAPTHAAVGAGPRGRCCGGQCRASGAARPDAQAGAHDELGEHAGCHRAAPPAPPVAAPAARCACGGRYAGC